MHHFIRNLLFGVGSLLAASASSTAQQIPAFSPATTLTFSGPGTYAGQFLGEISGSPVPAGSVQAAILGGISGITVANLSISGTPPNGAPVDGNQYVYGDITVTNVSTLAAGLLLSVSPSGTQGGFSGLDMINLQGTGPVGCPSDVTASVTITARPPVPIWGTDIWAAWVTIKNTSKTTLAGPVEFAVANLSGNASLFAAAGTGTCPVDAGQQYRFVATRLAAGEAKEILVTFTNSQVPSASITYTPKLLAGGSQL